LSGENTPQSKGWMACVVCGGKHRMRTSFFQAKLITSGW